MEGRPAQREQIVGLRRRLLFLVNLAQMAETEPHVFLSYVREDKAEVDRIQRLLEAAGVLVWRDTESLWPGEDWRIKIRQAITANALAFVACFSHNSEAKASTYQREELVLAIEQLRLRNPAQPWLIPVRLSDCALPQYDLGCGRTLDHLQRVDLFGDSWEPQSARLVAGVLRVLPPHGTLTVAPRATLPPPQTFMKEALLNPERQIELEDYVMELANSAAAILTDENLFPTTSPQLSNDNDGLRFLVAEANRYWDSVDRLIQALIPGCAWGHSRHEGIWTRAVERVANANVALSSGQQALISLRRFPMLPMLYAAGLAALHRQNFGALRAIAVDASYRRQDGAVPLVGAAHVWRPFAHAEVTPQLLVLELEGQELRDDIITALRTRQRGGRHTPVSDYLHDRLRPYFKELIPDQIDYTSTFDRLEVLLGVLAADVESHVTNSHVYVDGPWFGSFTWRDRFKEPTLEARLLAELRERGQSSPMLAAGLFGGQLERAESAFSAFTEGAINARQRRW